MYGGAGCREAHSSPPRGAVPGKTRSVTRHRVVSHVKQVPFAARKAHAQPKQHFQAKWLRLCDPRAAACQPDLQQQGEQQHEGGLPVHRSGRPGPRPAPGWLYYSICYVIFGFKTVICTANTCQLRCCLTPKAAPAWHCPTPPRCSPNDAALSCRPDTRSYCNVKLIQAHSRCGCAAHGCQGPHCKHTTLRLHCLRQDVHARQ